MSLRYAVYARKSQEDEGRQVQSIESQLTEVRRLAEREGLAIVEVFAEARSAWEPDNRPEFERLLRLVESGEVEGVLAWHPDRLSRNETDGAAVTRLLRKGALKDLRFASYHFFNSPEGIMMLQIALSQSQYQNSKMAVDVRRGMDTKRKEGWFPHVAPEGYFNELATRTIAADPVRFPLVRKAWDLLLSGHYTIGEVIDQLNALGYRTRPRRRSGGRPLSRTSGYKIFSNPFYTGVFRERGYLYPGKHPAMLTQEEFERAQDLIASRRRRPPVRREYPYSGLIRCARCGWGATTERQKGRHGRGDYVYLHCSNRNCHRGSLRQDRFEAQVEAHLRKLCLDPDLVQILLEEVSAWDGEDKTATETARTQRLRAIKEQEDSIKRMVDLVVRGVLDEQDFVEKRSEAERTLRTLKRELAEAENRDARCRTSVENALHFMSVALQLFKTGDGILRRRVLEALGLSYTIDAGALTISIHPLLQHTVGFFNHHTEPHILSSRSTKKEHFRAPALIGWAERLALELLQVASTSKPIPRLEAVATEQRPESDNLDPPKLVA
jgi:DNA invertase Pin-like site-specific DNA recombinase